MTKKLVRNAKTITFSLPPEIAEQMQEVMREEGRTMSELIREAPRSPCRTGRFKEDRLKKHLQPLTPAALYARVSSDRQDVELSGLRPLEGPPVPGPINEDDLGVVCLQVVMPG